MWLIQMSVHTFLGAQNGSINLVSYIALKITEQLDVDVMLQTCVLKAPGSNLGREIGCHD
jgi:hypothetical protein